LAEERLPWYVYVLAGIFIGGFIILFTQAKPVQARSVQTYSNTAYINTVTDEKGRVIGITIKRNAEIT
jgi:hypothetical protein